MCFIVSPLLLNTSLHFEQPIELGKLDAHDPMYLIYRQTIKTHINKNLCTLWS